MEAPKPETQRVAAHHELASAMRKLRAEIESKSEYVGPRFSEEARKIHYEETPCPRHPRRGHRRRGQGAEGGGHRVLSAADPARGPELTALWCARLVPLAPELSSSRLSSKRCLIPSPLGEKVAEGRMTGRRWPLAHKRSPPSPVRPNDLQPRHQGCGRGTRGRHAAVSHGLTSSPPRGEGTSSASWEIQCGWHWLAPSSFFWDLLPIP